MYCGKIQKFPLTHLVPGVCSFGRVCDDDDDLCPRHQSSDSLWRDLVIEVVCALLKQNRVFVCWDLEVFHVPSEE